LTRPGLELTIYHSRRAL